MALDLPHHDLVDCDGEPVATWTLGSDPSGDGSTAAVVVCHGTPWSARTWTLVARRLARGRRVRLWDMPGYGASPASPRLDLGSQAGRLARLLDRWGCRRPLVVAHDVGGAVALGAHLLHGSEYAGLFLWDAVVLEPWGSAFFDLARDHGDVLARLPPRLHRALVQEYVVSAAASPLPEEHVDVLVAPWTGPEGASRFYAQVAALSPQHTRPLAARLGDVRCPVRVGWGEDDPWLPVEQAHRLRDLLPPGTGTVTLAGTGHLVPLERPDDVTAALTDWWATLDPAGGG